MCRYNRAALRFDPEAILQQSGMDAVVITSFLHENYSHFIQAEAVEDVAAAAQAISDAGNVLCRTLGVDNICTLMAWKLVHQKQCQARIVSGLIETMPHKGL